MLLDACEITCVLGYQHDAGLAAGNGQEDVIGERTGHSFQINAVCVSQSREDIARLFPCRCRWGKNEVEARQAVRLILQCRVDVAADYSIRYT